MSSILKNLNTQQLEAVTATEGPILIIAGAGTGKTTVIARRIAYIIEKKLAKPSEILALTFTEKAAGEMEERVDQLVPYGFTDTWISTFHAFGDRVLRDNALDIGLSPDFKVLSRPQQVLFFQQNLFKFDLEYYRPLSNPTKFISAILSFFSRLKDENVTPKEFSNSVLKLNETDQTERKKYKELADCFAKYEKFKQEAGVLDFGDQVTKTLELFKLRPKVLRNYQENFKYLLVDEYQDTNYSQNQLVNLIAQNRKNICVVGDDDQSIYKFRGAAIANILEFKKSFKNAKEVVLVKNYRSTQAILDSAYRLIKNNNPERLEVQNKIDKKLISANKVTGSPPQEIFANTLSEEADQVASEIEKLTAKNNVTDSPRFASQEGQFSNVNSYTFRDIAILVRANSQAEHFLRALNMKGIPHKFVGASGLYQREEVKLLISFLYSICDFENSLNLYNLLTSDIYNLNPEDAIRLVSFAKRKTRSLYYVLKDLKKLKNEDILISEKSEIIIEEALKNIEESIQLSKKENVGKVLYDFLTKTGYLKKLDRNPSVENQIKIENVAKFFDKIKEFTQVANLETVVQFVEYLEAIRQAGDDPSTVDFDPDLNAVNVMTVHGAKGLEFPVVFMVNLVSDRFPTRLRTEQIEMPEELIKEKLPAGDWHIQEERRLFYVGITRAKDRMFFSWSQDTGQKRIKKISPFILESLDKIKSDFQRTKLSPLERIEKFKTVTSIPEQTTLFDVDVLKLTQGSIDDYLTCAFKYRYIHLLRLPILKHHAVVYGAALHAAVAQFNRFKKAGKNIPLSKLLEVFENSWDSEGFLTEEHEKKRKMQAKIALSEFHKRESKNKEIPTLIEQPFKFSLEGVTLVGRFDRVDISNSSKVTIIDYKSSENVDQEKANAQAKESIQLALYALYYFKKHKVIPEKLSLYFLETGIVGSHKPTIEDLKKTEKLILETAQNIKRDLKNNKFVANPKYFGREPACVYCAFSQICPFSLAQL